MVREAVATPGAAASKATRPSPGSLGGGAFVGDGAPARRECASAPAIRRAVGAKMAEHVRSTCSAHLAPCHHGAARAAPPRKSAVFRYQPSRGARFARSILIELHARPFSRRTLARWRTWWRGIFTATPFWRVARALWVPAVPEAALPAGLLERGDAASEVRAGRPARGNCEGRQQAIVIATSRASNPTRGDVMADDALTDLDPARYLRAPVLDVPGAIALGIALLSSTDR